MKKILLFGGIIVAIFIALTVVTSQQNQQAAEGNPFGLDTLEQETIAQLDDPLYQNIILPTELEQRLEENGEATVYFYSGQCAICNEVSPYLIPKAEEMGVDLELFNALEFGDEWGTYGIEGTPTVIHFEDGQEVQRIVGGHTEETYEQFFQQVVLAE
ncbi:thioredoxin family protein [Paenalkalicoccus suaedae]|uniref:Thioredoxin family protein n=1 Tax=Paenalkalicoccus suaedae TaxID=2592382 RepID=A0A859FJ67_9BACI|nr:thioredoxin family protein [Paenalkalicoccus suaedae]QKS72495.1 thioredoxin family protein [Paenalkalicoccus suaedae]